MPLIIITGTPLSGKSKRAQELKEYFEKLNNNWKCVVISDEPKLCQIGRNTIYSNASHEKELRSSLKSEVQRNLCSPETIVILDAANYIKGYRYELFCVAKEFRTNHLVVECDNAPEELLEKRFEQSTDDCIRAYSRNMFIELARRYEKPNANNRWDSPLFTIEYEHELPFKEIENAIFKRAVYTPNQSTQVIPTSSDNFIGQVDSESQEIIKHISNSLNMNQLQGIKIPNCDVPVNLNRKLSIIELNKLRRQFLNYCKMNPFKEKERIRQAFVQFINKSIII